MNDVNAIGQSPRISGTWKHCDGFSDVEFTFSLQDGNVSVSVLDTADGETPDVHDVRWNERELALEFAVHWSSGRFLKYRVAVGPRPDRVQATITSIHQELWERQ